MSAARLFITSFYVAASKFSAAVAPLLVDKKRVERLKNIPYGNDVSQRLDVYLPKNRVHGKRLPVSFFVHGGGFRYFSKDSHAAAAAHLSESGRIVICIDYRLAPDHPFPAGLTDAVIAYDWMVTNAERLGGDLTRISMVGESSGAGFIASLCLYFFGVRPFPSRAAVPPVPFARPKAVILHCGYYEVSDIERFREDPRCHGIVRERVAQIRQNYLPDFESGISPEWALADPQVVFGEMAARGIPLPKGFPEIFIPVGARDPVIGDSERLAAVLTKLGQTERLKVYPGVGHAFYAKPFGEKKKQIWTDIFQFLDRFGV